MVIGAIETNYYELWGVECHYECSQVLPHLIAVYDFRDVPDWEGCVVKHKDEEHPGCTIYQGVGPYCYSVILGIVRDCYPEPCRTYAAEIKYSCEQNGFWSLDNVATGYFINIWNPLVAPVDAIFAWITWYYNESSDKYYGFLYYLDCECVDQLLASGEFDDAPDSPEDFGWRFYRSGAACDDSCSANFTRLYQEATINGWIVYAEDPWVRRTSDFYSCYRFDMGVLRFKLSADTGSSIVGLDCNCQRVTYTDNYDLYARAYSYYEACACFDIRVMLLNNPQMFGVVDISFGDDTVRKLTTINGTVDYNDYLQRGPGGGDYTYCDYRHMYVIFDNTCIGMTTYDWNGRTIEPEQMIYCFYPDGSYELKEYGHSFEFVGKMKPFSTIPENNAKWPGINHDWKGDRYVWYYYGNESFDYYEIAATWSKSDAESALAEWEAEHGPYKLSIEAEFQRNTVSQPSFGPNHDEYLVQGGVYQYPNWPEADGMWHAVAPHYHSDTNIAYCLSYAETNKGYIINGQDGFHECMDVAGLNSFLNTGGISGTVYNDGCPLYPVRVCYEVKLSMGGCEGQAWWDNIMEQYEHDDEQSSQ